MQPATLNNMARRGAIGPSFLCSDLTNTHARRRPPGVAVIRVRGDGSRQFGHLAAVLARRAFEDVDVHAVGEEAAAAVAQENNATARVVAAEADVVEVVAA